MDDLYSNFSNQLSAESPCWPKYEFEFPLPLQKTLTARSPRSSGCCWSRSFRPSSRRNRSVHRTSDVPPDTGPSPRTISARGCSEARLRCLWNKIAREWTFNWENLDRIYEAIRKRLNLNAMIIILKKSMVTFGNVTRSMLQLKYNCRVWKKTIVRLLSEITFNPLPGKGSHLRTSLCH